MIVINLRNHHVKNANFSSIFARAPNMQIAETFLSYSVFADKG